MTVTRKLVYGVLGAVVAVVLSFLPFSPLLGGVVAGFLEGTDTREGTITGSISGLIMFAPFLGIGFLFLAFLGFLGAGGMAAGGLVIFVFVIPIVLTIFAYTLGLSALGGFLGAYLAADYPHRRNRIRESAGLGADETPPGRVSSRSSSRPDSGDESSDSESEPATEVTEIERIGRDRTPDDGRPDTAPGDGDSDTIPDDDESDAVPDDGESASRTNAETDEY